MSWRDRITFEKNVLGGKPCLRGTRIPVVLVLQILGEGLAEPMLIANYPGITHDDILACFAWAAHELKRA
jgi:uncharacterized protein (DUF433 family)